MLPGKQPFTYLITDGKCEDHHFDRCAAAISEMVSFFSGIGISAVQIREKALSSRNLLLLTRMVRDAVEGAPTLVLVNERVDIALAARADGVHLTSRSIPIARVREIAPRLVVGKSTHTVREVATAANEGADFVVFGPVFGTPGKPGVVGTAGLDDAVAASKGMPVIALGGVDQTNVSTVIAHGAFGFAGIRIFQSRESGTAAIEQSAAWALPEARSTYE